MKKVVLSGVLVLLGMTEVCICVALLPMRWQHPINQILFRALPHDQTAITHPALDLEIDQVLRDWPLMRYGLSAFWLLCLAFNTFLIVKTWRVLRRPPCPSP